MDDKKARKAILNKRDEILKDIQGAAESTKPVELDQQRIGRLSRMDAMQIQAMQQASQERRKQEVARLDAAIKRLDNGDYGYCISCEEDISPKRLALDPAATMCISCASSQG